MNCSECACSFNPVCPWCSHEERYPATCGHTKDTPPKEVATCATKETVPDSFTLRRLSVEFDVDPRTILKVARGVSVRGMAGHRAQQALSNHRTAKVTRG